MSDQEKTVTNFQNCDAVYHASTRERAIYVGLDFVSLNHSWVKPIKAGPGGDDDDFRLWANRDIRHLVNKIIKTKSSDTVRCIAQSPGYPNSYLVCMRIPPGRPNYSKGWPIEVFIGDIVSVLDDEAQDDNQNEAPTGCQANEDPPEKLKFAFGQALEYIWLGKAEKCLYVGRHPVFTESVSVVMREEKPYETFIMPNERLQPRSWRLSPAF